MTVAHFIAKNIWYIQIAVGAIYVLNLPIQILQLIMLGRLTFPSMLPITIPWYVFVFGGLSLMLGCLLVVGMILNRLDYVKVQTELFNQNNPLFHDVIQRLDRIEGKLPVGDDGK